MSRPARVTITESSPRDGLQSLGVFIPTDAKIGLIDDLSMAGLVSFDAVSFVSPTAAPQMADAAEVIAGVARIGVFLRGLVPNLRGLEAAVAAGVDGIGVLTAASDTFSERNINADVEESMDRIRAILDEVPAGLSVRAYISTITHCPYEGPTDPARVAVLAERLAEWGCDDLPGETLGKGTVGDVERGSTTFWPGCRYPVWACTSTTRTAKHSPTWCCPRRRNRQARLLGRRPGRCPHSAGGGSNVATEDVMWLLDGLGIDHDGDIQQVASVAARFCDEHNLPYRSRAGRATLAASEVEA